jgi:hypothetical protein
MGVSERGEARTLYKRLKSPLVEDLSIVQNTEYGVAERRQNIGGHRFHVPTRICLRI